MISRDDANKKLAEWIEPKPIELNPHGIVLVGECIEALGSGRVLSPKRSWHRGQWKENSDWQPMDFFTSEEASALLMEKMPLARVERTTVEWVVYCDWRKQVSIHGDAEHADRKTAIAEAALKLIEGSDELQDKRPACKHEHLDMDGICHRCGKDRRAG